MNGDWIGNKIIFWLINTDLIDGKEGIHKLVINQLMNNINIRLGLYSLSLKGGWVKQTPFNIGLNQVEQGSNA